jgi:hypothetical protein
MNRVKTQNIGGRPGGNFLETFLTVFMAVIVRIASWIAFVSILAGLFR